MAIGIPCIYGHLPVDNCMDGYGPERVPTTIGLEVKRIEDMADSVVRSGRIVEQFRRAVDWGCQYLYLVIQGPTRVNHETGMLETLKWDPVARKSGWMETSPPVEYHRWSNFLNTLEIKGNIHTIRTNDPWETAFQVVTLYHWWQTPPEEHSSLDRFHEPVYLARNVPTLRKMVKEIDGVGWQRSMDFFKTFTDQGLNIPQVLSLPAREFEKVKGVGKVTAKKIEEEMRKPVVTTE